MVLDGASIAHAPPMCKRFRAIAGGYFAAAKTLQNRGFLKPLKVPKSGMFHPGQAEGH